MTLIAWRTDFETGIPDVDHEHRALIALINELPAALDAGPGVAARDVLGDIHAGISAHFALEERLMRENRYDEYREHMQDCQPGVMEPLLGITAPRRARIAGPRRAPQQPA